ncbi:two-component system capsular synthesis sensor histidine kinase RcsC [Pseudomonas fluorescens]|uniref:hybrid sensor histidine kinase/response regulator n=1 Tax=Pseudomonas fluorescens TaxID=294 RepID=UPI0020A12CAF|nr:hybrid sensor histidine kinase/response regulator [Pseudomonas fluorescens]MCP1488438.1 two-component system capsular synthesis sensor histidine kinase RcsC [Pseudomonas fluorescens]
MRYKQSGVGRLEKISLRLGFGLIISFLFLLFFVIVGYWATYKVVRGELVKVNYHFLRLVARANDHETFLLRAIKASGSGEYKPPKSVGYVFKERLLGDLRLYEGKASQFATTVSVLMPDHPDLLRSGAVARELDQARGLANVYSDFWSGSSFTAPQMFLFDPDNRFDIAVPSIDSWAENSQLALLPVLEKVKATIARHPPKKSDLIVHWTPGERFLMDDRRELLAYISDQSHGYSGGGDEPVEVIAATLLELNEFNAFGVRIDKQFFDLPAFESIDLIAPDGSLLVGSPDTEIHEYENGLHLTTSGLLIKRSAGTRGTWQALYHISYERLLHNARWPLLGLSGLLVLCVLGGWWLTSWYRRRVVVPASSDYRELLVNHDFNHSLLQTVPLALCVIRAQGLEQVTQNSLFNDWLGESTDLHDLMCDWPMFDNGQALSGQGCLMTNGRFLHVRYAPTDFQGERVLLCTFTDISSHREAAATLVLARKVADAANEAKSNFVATISHEIRTPLYGVLGTLELLGMTDLQAQQRAYLATINSSSDALLHLISDVLDLSKIEAGQLVLEPVRFNPLDFLEEIMRLFAGVAANKGLALFSCIDPDVPHEIFGDTLRIRQVLSNLLSNAIKFTDSGHVAVFMSVAAAADGGPGLLWRVVDTGAGISPTEIERLFERFYQANNKQHTVKGTGLGLSICSMLSHLMGGTLTVGSRMGEGSEFAFTLGIDVPKSALLSASTDTLSGKNILLRTPFPELTASLAVWLARRGVIVSTETDLPHDALLEVMPEQLPALDWGGIRVFAQHDFSEIPQVIGKDILVSQHSLSGIYRALCMAVTGRMDEPINNVIAPDKRHLGLSVLLAEDSPVNQQLMKEQLQAIGCTVEVVSNGIEALKALESRSYDLILTDVNMPVMDGYRFTASVRMQNLEIPIIGVTANALRDEGERCIHAGMTNWLTKPIDIQGLYLCLKNSMAEPALNKNELLKTTALEDQLQIPERMVELFMLTVLEDLRGLKDAVEAGDADEIVRVLHRIRGALAVGKARSLIVLCREVERRVVSSGIDSAVDLDQFVQRVERAICMS